jgi:hypothetical protein
MRHVAVGSCFIDEHERGCLALEPVDQLVEVGLARSDGAAEVGRVGAVGLGVGGRDGILVDVQTDAKLSRVVGWCMADLRFEVFAGPSSGRFWPPWANLRCCRSARLETGSHTV